jgi:hypothetical protein
LGIYEGVGVREGITDKDEVLWDILNSVAVKNSILLLVKKSFKGPED